MDLGIRVAFSSCSYLARVRAGVGVRAGAGVRVEFRVRGSLLELLIPAHVGLQPGRVGLQPGHMVLLPLVHGAAAWGWHAPLPSSLDKIHHHVGWH